MLSLALAFIGGWAKKVLSNPMVITGLLILGALLMGRYWGKAVCERNQQEEVIREVKVYIEKKVEIEGKYNGNKFTDQQILSGCVAESTKNQPHCKEIK